MLADALRRTRTALGGVALAAAVAASPLAAAASPLGVTRAVAPAQADSGMVHYVGNKKNWNKGKWTGPGKKSGYYCRNCGYRGGYYYRPYYNNNWWVGPAIGFGTGVIVGGLLTQPRYYAPAPRYYAPRAVNRDAYCHQKYRSYNSRTGTYTGYDGKQHYCRIP